MSMRDPITTFELNNKWRDHWSEYMPHALEQVRPLQYAGCFVPRFFQAPSSANAAIATTNGYSRATMVIPAGSWIIGWANDVSGVSTPYNVQVTDVTLQHSLFSDPIPITYLAKNGEVLNLLHRPYPVIGTGVFTVEFWSAIAQTCTLTAAVAVPEGAFLQ